MNIEILEHGFFGEHAHLVDTKVVFEDDEGSETYGRFSNLGLPRFAVAAISNLLDNGRAQPAKEPTQAYSQIVLW